jgi:hypothetical protein
MTSIPFFIIGTPGAPLEEIMESNMSRQKTAA